ncbi:MAG: hypothetical protein GC162_16860 [Planctomycetes bacterium]|nr:hypothetical protein [Planctomycetota bacterium]
MSDWAQDIFSHVLLRPAEASGSPLALLTWRATKLGEHVVQVYVNDVLTEVIADATQNELWLHLDRARTHRVGLLAAPADQAWVNQHAELANWSPPFATRASLAIVRDEALPIDSRVIVTIDGVDEAGRPLWEADDPRGGFGGLLGVGPFGHDTSTSPGWGLGEMGIADFGTDNFAFRWERDDLLPGEHTIGMRIEDARGRLLSDADEQLVTIDAVPTPAANLTIENDFTLRWN